MIDWHFYINGTEVTEPQGWADVVINVSRDDNWHGVFFEASQTTLTFYDDGADLLRAEKAANGLASSASFRAEAVCGEIVDVIEGSFDFGTYREKCGVLCGVEITTEKTGCLMTLRNRYEQKVNLQKETASNNTTLLQHYSALDFEIDMLPQKLGLGAQANTGLAPISGDIRGDINFTDSDGFNNYIGWISPAFPNVTNESFGEFNTVPILLVAGPLDGVPNRPPYPTFPTAVGTATLIGDIACDLEDNEATFRMKGSASATFSGSGAVSGNLRLLKLPNGLDGTVAANWQMLYTTLLFSRTTNGTTTFDTGDVTAALTINQGDFIYFGISTRGSSLPNISTFTIVQDIESYYSLTAKATCDPTESFVSMVNEIGSRLVESITDSCMDMKSDYYGRTDSQPYTSSGDGCGSLRVLTNGRKLRRALESNHFISLKEYFDGLRGIDNIGMGIEDNPAVTGRKWMRVEPVEYFYQDELIMRCPSIPEAESPLEPKMGYSIIKIGYQEWEVNRVNGLNEFNSNREYKTSLPTINNTLDATSNFVAGGIPIEITRQQAFATTGAADTRYDDDTFIICVSRGGYFMQVEQGNIDNSAGVFDPPTTYNWRIRPMSNLMRWFKSIAHIYNNLSNTISKVFFSSGTGNYTAEGELATPDACKIEATVIAENANLSLIDFADAADAQPIYRPETVSFKYPMSVNEYLRIIGNPYGYIEYQCGSGSFEKGFIKTIQYKPVAGEAVITLIKKWQ